MELKELESKLQAAQERVDKAYATKAKYQERYNKAKEYWEANYNEKYSLTDNNFLLLNYWDIPNDVWEANDKLRTYTDAMKDSDRNIKELERVRDGWRTKVELQKTKDTEVANIPQVIKDFVHDWRIRVRAYFMKRMEDFIIAYKKAWKIHEEAQTYPWSSEERTTLTKQYNAEMAELSETFDSVVRSLAFRSDKEAELDKILDAEERTKIFDLVKRISAVTGEIVDAKGLSIGGQQGELNGIVIGKEGKAKVQTVGAGGYNQNIIVNDKHGQRFHYRVLVNKVR